MREKRAASSGTDKQQTHSDALDSATVIPIVEEQIVVDRYVVERGKVRVSKRVTEREETVDAPVLREEVKVERVPIGTVVDAAPEVRREGDVLIVPVVEEQVVLQKRLVLVEELRIRKEVYETHQTQKITLLKEQVDVSRVAGDDKTGG